MGALRWKAGLAGALCACCVGHARGPEDHRIKKQTEIVHEPCESSGTSLGHDLNGDGRAESTAILVDNEEVCRVLDFNFDGVPDRWVYWGRDGTVRRRESDFDRDGQVDEIDVYSRGHLISRVRGTSLGGRLDTWHRFRDGVLVATERDANGDSYVDQWWEYPKPDSPECALIHSDVDGDGRPDPGATVDLCDGEDDDLVEQVERPSVLDPGGLGEQLTETVSEHEQSEPKQKSAPGEKSR